MYSDHIDKDMLNGSFSQQFIDHATNPKNIGSFSVADGFARLTGPCGDTVEISLSVKDDIIQNASFQTDGCAATVACADIAIDMIKGNSIAEIRNINQNKILDALGGLPDELKHCALLVSNTLKEAIRDYLLFKRESWKKAYRK